MTNTHHIFQPFTLEAPEAVGVAERIVGIALAVFLSVLTFGVWTAFNLAAAIWKQCSVPKDRKFNEVQGHFT